MSSMQMFRSALSGRGALGRALQIVVVALLAAPALAIGCGGKVAVDRDAGEQGTGGEGEGGSGGRTGGGSTIDGGVCALVAYGVGAGQTKLPECFERPSMGCPKQYDAVLHIVPSSPCVYLVSVNCGPVELANQCCYMVTEEEKSCD